MEDSGFQLVSRKKAARVPKTPSQSQLSLLQDDKYEGASTSEILTRISELKQKLKDNQFFEDIIATIKGALELQPVDILCYGIGRLGSCRIAQTQFALLQLIKEHFRIIEGLLYDPVLHKVETAAIEQSFLSVLPYNEGCKRHLIHPTLVYMVHCGQSMYNHLLWANWNKRSLAHVILIGNRLSSYHERNTCQQLKEKSYYIHKAIDICREVMIKNSYDDHVIFNDIAVHVFPQHRLDTIPASVWDYCVEPSPDCTDNEIVL